ncbi:MAG TPA: DNA alkylation repair protein [Thermoanaerobaculia bacterium]|jgi:3-methyladenine DNA glycosylase AlkD|nr:DNA alkylation repair protein [Thermoanaerobaculia bacterium]
MLEKEVQKVLASLKKMSTQRDRDNLARFGITATNPLGVSMANMQRLAKSVGRSHELAAALWDTNCYEARMLTAFIDEPTRVTPTQMDRWCRDFDNWAICDTLCFKLWDQTPHAWSRVAKWNSHRDEFVKRAAYALIASLALHDRKAPDEPFVESLAFIERAASDDRNFVKKGVSWALRSVGRRNPRLYADATEVATRLAASKDAAPRWIGKDALRDFRKSAE